MGEGEAGTGPARRRRVLLRAAAALCVAAPALGPVACGTPVEAVGAHPRGAGGDVALLGVVGAPGIDVGTARDALDALAAAAFERAGPARFEGPSEVRTEIDGARLDAILEGFGASGALVPEALQTLMAAPIRHRRAVLLRIEENAVERLDPVVEPVRGRPRERRVVRAVRRRVRVAATRVDLNSGAVRPLGAWTTAAEARVEHLDEGGDGFVASVAATLADRMAGRPGAPPPPEPPPPEAALRVLFDEIARELPAG